MSETMVKRKVLLGSAITAAILSTAYIGGAYVAGKAAEKTLQKQHEWLSSLPYFIVKNREYQPGWFSSSEKTTLLLNPELYRFFIERAGTELPKFEVTYTQKIKHGPFPLLGSFNLRPYKAVVESEFIFSPETQKFLTQFFGTQKPIHIENRIGFNDDGVISVKVPSFDYEEAISGVKAKWKGFDATLNYGGDFNSVKLIANAPGLSGEAKGKLSFAFNDLTFGFDHIRGKTGVMLGTTTANLAGFDMLLSENTPIKLKLENLKYAGNIAETGEFINGGANINLAKLILDDQPYGPAELQATASHLHGPTLAKLADEFTALQKKQLKRDEFSAELVKLVKTHGMPLLTHDPLLAIKKFDVKLPDGSIRFTTEVGLKGFKPADLDKPVEFVSKLHAKADFSVPRKVIETMVMWQARNMFGGPDSGVAADDLDYLAGQFVEGQINKLTDQNLIRSENGLLSAKASLEKGAFLLNGINVPLPWQQPAESVTEQ
ncbi:MAG: YdgA family protein [Proteobacteria bacterium]|nr:YdgA family protein [Pseudomonadota bacterium]